MKLLALDILLVILSLLLTACTSLVPPTNSELDWETRQTQLTALEHFKVQGKISLRAGNQTEKISFYWVQKNKDYMLSLYGPLGMGHHVVKSDGISVTLIDPKGHPWHAASPEELLYSQVGWDVPVSGLVSWLKGLPILDTKAEPHFDRYHHLETLTQENWQITYSDYTAVGQYDLPTRIVLMRSSSDAEHALQIVIVVYRWEL